MMGGAKMKLKQLTKIGLAALVLSISTPALSVEKSQPVIDYRTDSARLYWDPSNDTDAPPWEYCKDRPGHCIAPLDNILY